MKKIILAILATALLLLQIGCLQQNPVRSKEQAGNEIDLTSKDVSENSDASENEIDLTPTDVSKYSDVSENEIDLTPTDVSKYSDVSDNYNDYWRLERKDYSDKYPKKTDEVVRTETENGYILSVPVLGTYFEKTDMTSFILYEDGKFIGIETEKDGYDISKISEKTVGKDGETIVDEWRKDKFISFYYGQCIEEYPDFEITAIIEDTESNLVWRIVGKENSDAEIRVFWEGTLQRIMRIGKEKTVDGVRKAFEKNDEFMLTLGEKLKFFPFTSTENDIYGYGSSFTRDTIICHKKDYYDYYDRYVALPVRDADGNDNCCLYLLIRENTVFGEIVIKLDNPGTGNDITAYTEIIYENLGEKTGSCYDAVRTIGYLDALSGNEDASYIACDGSKIYAVK